MRDQASNPLSGLFAEREVLTVSALTERIRRSLEPAFRDLEVQGEVSNFKVHTATGNWYFTLKDRNSQIRVVFYRQFNRLLRFAIEDGLEIRIRGRLTVYSQRGDYQITVDTAAPVKTGALQLAFEQMRRRLDADGLFEKARKRRLPFLPRRIGVVTSLDGAVSRDIVNILQRRNPAVSIFIVPVHVQGTSAGGEIVDAIRFLNQGASQLGREVDAIIVARGGGSAEDLWAFNEERVARAIFTSRVPVISAVGHETDVTIADLVADLRAPTPSAAAEMVAPAADELRARIGNLRTNMHRLVQQKLDRHRARLSYLISSPGFTSTETRFRDLASHWKDLESRTVRAFEKALESARLRVRDAGKSLASVDLIHPLRLSGERVASLEQALVRAIEREVTRRRGELAVGASKLEMLSPLKVLGRGYLLAQRTSGQLVTQARGLAAGDRLRLRFADGDVGCEITETVDQTPQSS